MVPPLIVQVMGSFMSEDEGTSEDTEGAERKLRGERKAGREGEVRRKQWSEPGAFRTNTRATQAALLRHAHRQP